MRKKNLKNKKILVTMFVVVTLLALITMVGCGDVNNLSGVNADGEINSQKDASNADGEVNSQEDASNAAKIKFSEMYEKNGNDKDVSALYKQYNGKKVEITGYMAVQSPLDESFVYLVGQPYVSCPFCAIGDVTKLEIIPIFMANGSKIKYRENGVTIKGTLEVAPKVDSEGYTTQCRILADSVTNISDENVDKDLQQYYANLSEAGMIIDIQTLQMDIEYMTNEEYMQEYGTTKVEIVNSIAEMFNETNFQIGGYSGILGYLTYIKECPDIVNMCEPTREDLIAMNNELISIYNEQIKVLEKFALLVGEAQQPQTTDDRKEKIYTELTKLNKSNLQMFEKFTAWDNKLRSN